MEKANLIYFGSPDFSAQILESLLATRTDPVGKVVGVVTTPDKPTGRKQAFTPSPVAVTAAKHDLPIFKPAKLDDANLSHLKLLRPDIFLVVSFKKIIPSNWLSTPAIGTFNLHFSLLPKYRGALCISEAIKNQDRQTGVSLMVMDEQMDHGSVISQAKVTIDIDDNIETLTKKLTQAGINLLSEYLPRLATPSSPPPSEGGGWVGVPQNENKATYTPLTKTRNRDSAFIGWSVVKKAIAGEDASTTHALIRSNNPDPGAWTKLDDLEIKLIQTRLDQKNNRLEIETVQLPGKKPVSWKNFIAGHQA